jgi:hypothetical protein
MAVPPPGNALGLSLLGKSTNSKIFWANIQFLSKNLASSAMDSVGNDVRSISAKKIGNMIGISEI